MRPKPPRPALVALAASALLCSCGLLALPPRATVVLDEAFAAARPGLAENLERPSSFAAFPASLFRGGAPLRVTLSEGAGRALDAAMAEERRIGSRVALVTSPLIAKAILGGGTWSGDPALLVPEWRGPPTAGLWSASTDPTRAYREAGAAAGAFIRALAEGGGAPSCGVVFAEGPSRTRSALDAFAAAYARSSEDRPLAVREPGPTAAEAEAAVAELLRSDLRLLFLSLGPAAGAAIRAATRPGLLVGADLPLPESPAGLAFMILPDDPGLVRALDRARRGLAKAGPAMGSEAVPALLVAGPAAGAARAGGRDFSYFLSEASSLERAKPKIDVEGAALRANALR